MRIGLATCRPLPEADEDEELLLAALSAAGHSPGLCAWNDPADDPTNFDLMVLRSTWDYPLDPGGFESWLLRLRVPCWNPLTHVLANLRKRYLLELEVAGIPIVPTLLLEHGERTELAPLLAERGWMDVVVKPEVSGSSFCTRRFETHESAARDAFAASLQAERCTLVQPYLASIEQGGERALVWIDGEFTHAAEKAPSFLGHEERVPSGLPLEDDERRFGARVIEAWRERHAGHLLYGRVDVIRDDEGKLALSELELVEPSLFLASNEAALARFVRAISALVSER